MNGYCRPNGNNEFGYFVIGDFHDYTSAFSTIEKVLFSTSISDLIPIGLIDVVSRQIYPWETLKFRYKSASHSQTITYLLQSMLICVPVKFQSSKL